MTLSREDHRDFESLLAVVPLDESSRATLAARMSEPHRFYHDGAHLALLWRRHRIYGPAEALTTPEIEPLIACAIAFHDVIYDMGAKDNEERSADFWLRSSARGSFSIADRMWVADTIRATQDHLAYVPNFGSTDASRLRERARQWMLDLDLTPLGEAPADFDRNTELLRKEAAHLSQPEWDAGRLGFLRRFAEAPQVYRTPTIAALFEPRARANFARELETPAG